MGEGKNVIEYTVEVYVNGTKEWYLNDLLHREDGPAVEYPDGTKTWFLNGEYHRGNGPAIERSDGTKEWYLNGEPLTEEEHRAKTSSSPCNGKTVVIDGKTYTLTEVK